MGGCEFMLRISECAKHDVCSAFQDGRASSEWTVDFRMSRLAWHGNPQRQSKPTRVLPFQCQSKPPSAEADDGYSGLNYFSTSIKCPFCGRFPVVCALRTTCHCPFSCRRHHIRRVQYLSCQ